MSTRNMVLSIATLLLIFLIAFFPIIRIAETYIDEAYLEKSGAYLEYNNTYFDRIILGNKPVSALFVIDLTKYRKHISDSEMQLLFKRQTLKWAFLSTNAEDQDKWVVIDCFEKLGIQVIVHEE